MQEIEKREVQIYIQTWRKSLPHLADNILFDIDYWEIEKGNEIIRNDQASGKEKHCVEIQENIAEIEKIWAFCILMEEKTSPLQKVRKNYAEKEERAIEGANIQSLVLADDLRKNKLNFVNKIRAFICATSFDRLHGELMVLYRVYNDKTIVLATDTLGLDVEAMTKTENLKSNLWKELSAINRRIEEIEDEIFKKNQSVRQVGVTNIQRELATTLYYKPAQQFAGIGQGNKW